MGAYSGGRRVFSRRQAGRQASKPLIRKIDDVLARPRLTQALAHASELHVHILGLGLRADGGGVRASRSW